jgi:antitoxin ParD1/3/4
MAAGAVVQPVAGLATVVNTSESIRDLIRRDQEEQARQRLRDLPEAGVASGPGRRLTPAEQRKLMAIASVDDD